MQRELASIADSMMPHVMPHVLCAMLPRLLIPLLSGGHPLVVGSASPESGQGDPLQAIRSHTLGEGNQEADSSSTNTQNE